MFSRIAYTTGQRHFSRIWQSQPWQICGLKPSLDGSGESPLAIAVAIYFSLEAVAKSPLAIARGDLDGIGSDGSYLCSQNMTHGQRYSISYTVYGYGYFDVKISEKTEIEHPNSRVQQFRLAQLQQSMKSYKVTHDHEIL